MTISTRRIGSLSSTNVLGVVFVVLKLCGVIDWSWVWVTLPFWGPLAIFLLVVLFVLVVMGVIGFLGGNV